MIALNVADPWRPIIQTTDYVCEFYGEVAEWSKAVVLKTIDRVSGPWVRIPASPQEENIQQFY